MIICPVASCAILLIQTIYRHATMQLYNQMELCLHASGMRLERVQTMHEVRLEHAQDVTAMPFFCQIRDASRTHAGNIWDTCKRYLGAELYRKYNLG